MPYSFSFGKLREEIFAELTFANPASRITVVFS